MGPLAAAVQDTARDPSRHCDVASTSTASPLLVAALPVNGTVRSLTPSVSRCTSWPPYDTAVTRELATDDVARGSQPYLATNAAASSSGRTSSLTFWSSHMTGLSEVRTSERNASGRVER